jgi:hypothetical protein
MEPVKTSRKASSRWPPCEVTEILISVTCAGRRLSYGDVETLLAAAPDSRPFDRLIIGSKTIGGAFDAPGLSGFTAT